ncbi:MAG: TIGR00282 family metallophosphoesterase, partial [Alphaproteobacteria bacterium]
ILFLGDVVGRAGRNAICNKLPHLRERYRLDFVIVNGENAAGGFGITETICADLIDAGADVVTGGNHMWDQRDALVFIERQQRLLRPANFPPGAPGRGAGLFEAQNGAQVMVINVMGRVFMDALDCPFHAADRELGDGVLKAKADAIVIDIHGEASSEKQALGHFVDGRASAVIGTHTHVPTSDDRILPGGTAFMTDAGMCGDYDSVIGMQKNEPLRRFQAKISSGRLEPAAGEASLSGLAIETDDATGLAIAVEPLRLGGTLRPSQPKMWLE